MDRAKDAEAPQRTQAPERALADASAICAYCGRPELSAGDPPEHPIPHALGASLHISTVCAACNEWANVYVDQPFLRDDFTRAYRALHDIRDPRRPRHVVPHPMSRGHTEDGTYVTFDRELRPHLHGRILEDPTDSDSVTIHAGSKEEAERLKQIVIRRAASEGKACEITGYESTLVQPEVNIQFTTNVGIWLSAAAKMALGIASAVYPPAWRAGPDAQRLRRLMRSDDPRDATGRPILGILPRTIRRDDLLGKFAEPPEHVVWFVRGNDEATRVFILLFGELLLPMTVETTRAPLPTTAWRLDPRRPRADGRTTYESLMAGVMQRVNSGPALLLDQQPAS